MKKHLTRLLFTIWLCLVCADSHAACLETDKDCVTAAHREHVVNRISFWKASLDKPLLQRIGPAPAELIDYLKLDNILNEYPERPTSATLPPDFQRDINAAISELPDKIKHALGGRLAGIYLVHNLGGSGFTEAISDASGKPVAAYVVLDIDTLEQRKANEWATWKENSPFRANGVDTLVATIESPSNDNRKNAIQYILLHEFGHVLSVGRHFHPPWTQDSAAVNASEYPFFALSWRFDKGQNKFVTDFEDRFPLRKQVVYYFGAKLNASQMTDVYGQLETTNFPTLYGATNPYDDFAESFVNYVHTVLMGKPFEIQVENKGKVVKRYGSCWGEKRCEEKRKVLEGMVGGF
jgi:hypothetical protein